MFSQPNQPHCNKLCLSHLQGHTVSYHKSSQRLTITRYDDLPQLATTTYHNSFERVTITLYHELPQLVVGSFGHPHNTLTINILHNHQKGRGGRHYIGDIQA